MSYYAPSFECVFIAFKVQKDSKWRIYYNGINLSFSKRRTKKCRDFFPRDHLIKMRSETIALSMTSSSLFDLSLSVSLQTSLSGIY